MTIQSGDSPDALDISQAGWRLDPTRSSVEFHVRHFYGLITVKGRFERFEGTLDLRSKPAVQLTIEADTLDTKHKKRDHHLRSADLGSPGIIVGEVMRARVRVGVSARAG